MSQINIRKAKHSDIDQMIEICEQNLVENNLTKFSAEDFSKKGFLLTRLTSENAKKMIDDRKDFVVLVAENKKENSYEILGYLIGCDIKKSQIDFPSETIAKKNLAAAKTFYHKQIVKKTATKNIGKKLLSAMIEMVKDKKYQQIICRIVHQPFKNEASIIFHEKFDFTKIGKMSHAKITFGIYLKNLCSS
ncbi:MAG: hypothetical protein SFV53_03290 [Rickettsiales bacterium]|nr:hypothetical protein [Rickettsiales bacterium]